MSLDKLSQQSNPPEKRKGRKYVITGAHDKGSLTEGSETYGQTKTSTVYTGGESGMKEGSRVKKVEFHDNKTEQRKRETQYFNTGRKVTRYEDRVEVIYGDGKIKDPELVSKEIYYSGKKITTYGDGREVITEKKERQTLETHDRNNINPEQSPQEIRRNEVFDNAKVEIGLLLDTLIKSASVSEAKVDPLNETEVSNYYSSSKRESWDLNTFKDFIQRISLIKQRIEYLESNSESISKKLESNNLIELEQKLRYAINSFNNEDSKKWPLRKNDEVENKRKLKDTIQEDLNKARLEREALVTELQNCNAELDNLKKSGIFYSSESSTSSLERFSREYIERVIAESFKTLPEYESINSLISQLETGDLILDPAPSTLEYRDFLTTQLKITTKENINKILTDYFDSKVGPDLIIKPFKMYDLDSRRPNLNDALLISSLYNSSEARKIFGESELIDSKYKLIRDFYTSEATNLLMDPRLKKQDASDPREILADNFYDKDSLKLNFLNSIYLERSTRERIIDRIESSEEDVADLKKFFGEDEFNKYFNVLKVLTQSKGTIDPNSRSVIDSLKDKFLIDALIKSPQGSVASPAKSIEVLFNSISDQSYDLSLKNNFSIRFQNIASSVLSSPEIDGSKKYEFINAAAQEFIRNPLKSDKGIEAVLATFEAMDPEEFIQFYPDFMNLSQPLTTFIKNIYSNPTGYYSPYILDTRMWKILNFYFGNERDLNKKEGLDSATSFLGSNLNLGNPSYHSPFDNAESSIYSFMQDILGRDTAKVELGNNIMLIASLLPSGTRFSGNVWDLQFFRRQDLISSFPYVFNHPELAKDFFLKLVDIKNVSTLELYNLLSEANTHIEQIKKAGNE